MVVGVNWRFDGGKCSFTGDTEQLELHLNIATVLKILRRTHLSKTVPNNNHNYHKLKQCTYIQTRSCEVITRNCGNL